MVRKNKSNIHDELLFSLSEAALEEDIVKLLTNNLKKLNIELKEGLKMNKYAAPECPKCGSHDLKQGLDTELICNKCGHRFDKK